MAIDVSAWTLREWLAVGDIILKVVVTFAGACWAIVIFLLLRQRETAAASLKKLEVETEKARVEARRAEAEARKGEVELRTRETAGLILEMDVKVLPDDAAAAFVLIAKLTMRNLSGRPIRMSWEENTEPLQIFSVGFDNEGAPHFTPRIRLQVRSTYDPNIAAPAHIIRPGGSEEITFVTRINSPGLYAVNFRARLDAQEQAASESAGATRPAVWSRRFYVTLPPVSSPGRSMQG